MEVLEFGGFPLNLVVPLYIFSFYNSNALIWRRVDLVTPPTYTLRVKYPYVIRDVNMDIL